MQKLSGKMERIRTTALENNKNCTEEVIFQVKGQRQTKNTFEKKVFFALPFLVLKMGNGREKQADSEGGKNKMNRIEDVTNYITECDQRSWGSTCIRAWQTEKKSGADRI